MILKSEYTNYTDALQTLNLVSLSDRRLMLAKRFALKCLKNDRFKDLFPRNRSNMELRGSEKYLVKFCNGRRLQKSSIPAMQRILNRK